jgi:hypothetical protein
MTQALSISPDALREGANALRADLEYIKSLSCNTPELHALIGGLLIEQLKVLDAMQEQRDGVTKPMHEAWKNACALFSEGLDLQKQICAALKTHIAAYELTQAEAKALATEQARAALVAGDVATIERALTVVNEAAPAPVQGVSTTFKWAVKRLAEAAPCQHCGSTRGMLPREFWTEGADLGALNALAGKCHDNEPPIVPGVVFERAASVTGRRK